MSAHDMTGLALILGGFVPWGFGVWWLYRRRQERLREQAWRALAGPPPLPLPLQMLRLGDSGPLVRHWQWRLRMMGYEVEADGRFGGETYRATRHFQGLHDLARDGIVGPRTWTAMLRCG